MVELIHCKNMKKLMMWQKIQKLLHLKKSDGTELQSVENVPRDVISLLSSKHSYERDFEKNNVVYIICILL